MSSRALVINILEGWQYTIKAAFRREFPDLQLDGTELLEEGVVMIMVQAISAEIRHHGTLSKLLYIGLQPLNKISAIVDYLEKVHNYAEDTENWMNYIAQMTDFIDTICTRGYFGPILQRWGWLELAGLKMVPVDKNAKL